MADELLPWRFAYASTRGRSHVESDLPSQDSSSCILLEDKGVPLLIATVSDGAGSASHSEIGSGLACASFVEEISSLVKTQGGASPPDRSQIETWLTDLAQEIQVRADELGVPPRELACTFVGAVLTPTWSVFCQVGDGGVVIGLPASTDVHTSTYELIFWPEQGEYANETYFATMPGAPEHLQFSLDERLVREVALFSDGLQRMVLRYEARVPFDPFFHRMLQTVRRTEGTGELHHLSRGLGAYLGSPMVFERTDDDVSLVLATRCPELADPPPLNASVQAAETVEVEVSDVAGLAVEDA